MITDAIIEFFVGIFETVLGTLPEVQTPEWLNAGSSMVGTVFGYADSMSVWFPSALAFTVGGTLIAVWLVGFLVNSFRMIVSLISGGGGSL